MVVTTTRITADEYLAMGEDPWGRRTELIDGVIVITQPSPWHQHAVLEIASALLAWRKGGTDRGFVSLPLDIKRDEYNVYAPDALWYAPGRAPAMDDPRPYPPPDLVVEVRSPSTWRLDVGPKKSGYEAIGVPELWLVDFAAVLVFRRSRPDAPAFDVALELTPEDVLTSSLLHGFELSLAALYPPA